MSKKQADLEAICRQVAEAALLPSDVELLRLIRQAITGAGLIRVERLSAPLPPNAHGTINDESVVVSFPDYTASIDLESLLGEILAAQAAPQLAIQELDADPSGNIRTLIVPDGSLTVDEDTATLDFSSISSLDELSDVNAPAPDDGDLLAWDSTPGEWVNVPATATSGRYQMYVLTSDGMGGFNFVTDIDGNLVTSLEYLE